MAWNIELPQLAYSKSTNKIVCIQLRLTLPCVFLVKLYPDLNSPIYDINLWGSNVFKSWIVICWYYKSVGLRATFIFFVDPNETQKMFAKHQWCILNRRNAYLICTKTNLFRFFSNSIEFFTVCITWSSQITLQFVHLLKFY